MVMYFILHLCEKKQQGKNWNLLYVNLINNHFIHIFTETPKTVDQHTREQC